MFCLPRDNHFKAWPLQYNTVITGTLELDLRNLVAPAKTPEKCSLTMMDDVEIGAPHKTEQAKSLFAQQSVRGWWPCSIEKDGKKALGVSMNRKYAERDMRAFLGKLACSNLYYWGNELTTMGLRLEWRQGWFKTVSCLILGHQMLLSSFLNKVFIICRSLMNTFQLHWSSLCCRRTLAISKMLY